MRLHHLALGARDVELVAAFYRDVLGLPELARNREVDGRVRSVWLGIDGAVLMVERVRDLPGPGRQLDCGLFLLALEAAGERRASLEQALAGAGVAIEARTARTAYFRDPEGNRVALSDYPLPANTDKGTQL
jgi:catechol 2,3-dioxygenase-like lactoylglutathione lyase family enzyme